MSPTLNSRQAKAKLRHDIVRILNVLQHKTLETQELTYILTAVLNAKALYYLNIVPLSDSDLAAFDRKIKALLRRTAGMARSSNIDVFHLPSNMWGYNVPTLVLTRRNLLIGQLHRITNAPDSILGQLARLRLRDYRDACGATSSPLHQSPPSHLFEHHWYARAHSCLAAANIQMHDRLDTLTIPPPRPTDISLLDKSTLEGAGPYSAKGFDNCMGCRALISEAKINFGMLSTKAKKEPMLGACIERV
jgi:hypothetical protein